MLIDAITGDVVREEQDRTDDREQAIDLTQPMTYDAALEKALAARDGELRGWKLEGDDGRREYQFDIAQQGVEKEVTVDVDSGQVTVD
ncbi:PepSY domain-containing protein [Brachybacterium huguangmaarense]|uniref:PepSY domain-containing protein n=1 Tax=Brachybacterium huguangmaarense TaxID=1652028 RepID=A0ABY6G0Y5_9MICO|nr:PepSY domain-containing protein [Brachybacterium huguangmaarense]UYG16851.1 PepSY domain-containing protein [Brachybacterium huguangmaarense]